MGTVAAEATLFQDKIRLLGEVLLCVCGATSEDDTYEEYEKDIFQAVFHGQFLCSYFRISILRVAVKSSAVSV